MSQDRLHQSKAYLQIGLIVGQVNRIELELNELIEVYFVRPEKVREFSEDIMFSNKISLHSKLVIALSIMDRLGVAVDKEAVKRWKGYRNAVAHGIPGYNTQTGKPELLYSGRQRPLESIFGDFGATHDVMISMLKSTMEKIKK